MKQRTKLILILLVAAGLLTTAGRLVKTDMRYQGAGEIWWTTVPQIEEAYQRLTAH